MCFKWLEENATGVLLAVLIVLMVWLVFRKDKMCGGSDQGCRCCGFEPMATMNNRRIEDMEATMHNRRVEGMEATMRDRRVEDVGVVSEGMYGEPTDEQMRAQPIIYDDMLFNIQHGTV